MPNPADPTDAIITALRDVGLSIGAPAVDAAIAVTRLQGSLELAAGVGWLALSLLALRTAYRSWQSQESIDELVSVMAGICGFCGVIGGGMLAIDAIPQIVTPLGYIILQGIK